MSRSRYTLLIDSLIHWFIDSLIHWFINSLKNQSVSRTCASGVTYYISSSCSIKLRKCQLRSIVSWVIVSWVIVSCHNVHKMTYNYAVYDVTLMLSFAVLVLILSVVIFISPNVVNKLIIIFYVCLEKKMKILPCQNFWKNDEAENYV